LAPRNEDPQWVDAHGVIHYVGTHVPNGEGRTIYTECYEVISHTKEMVGFYDGNICGITSCVLCMATTKFGTHAP
jgi:hypothetical protein